MTKINLTTAQLAKIAHLFTPPSNGDPFSVFAQIYADGTVKAQQITGETAINVAAAKAGLAKPSKLNRARIVAEWKKQNGGGVMKRYNIDADTCEVYECYNGEYVKYEDSASYNAALEAKCADLEQQLASMTAERDSESRWAKQYHDEAVALREQLDAEQGRINEPEEGA